MSLCILETILRQNVAMEVPYIHIIRPKFLAPNEMVDTISKHRKLYSWEAERNYQADHHTANLI